MTQEKFSAPPLKARQIILARKIEEARNFVIEADIELDFLNNIKRKINTEKLKFDNSTVTMIDEHIKLYTNNHDLFLEKLNFLKEMRELKRADKIARYIENTTPDKISVKV